jgi:hypothetical protein
MHVYVYTLCKLLNEGAISLCCSNIVDVSSYEELKEAIAEGKWARGPWSARYELLQGLLHEDILSNRNSFTVCIHIC